jgi:hypothetical protein
MSRFGASALHRCLGSALYSPVSGPPAMGWGPLKPPASDFRYDLRQHMPEIILEGVLFVALIATVGTLFYMLLMYFTPVGVRFRQRQNRKRLDRAAELVCPIHGPRSSTDLVRLTSGELLCPDCYKENFHG